MTNLLQIIHTKKAFLWDFDGCFCDSEHVHYLAYSKAFAAYGHTVDRHEYFDTFTNSGAGAAREIERYGLSCSPEDIKKAKETYYWELIEKGEATLFPEIPRILTLLKNMGIQNVIASNSSAREIELVLGQASQKIILDGIIGFEPGLRKKPFPDIFNKALEFLNVTPQNALIVEDSERGLLAAQAAHCDAIWIRTPISDRFNSTVPHLAKITHAELLQMLEAHT